MTQHSAAVGFRAVASPRRCRTRSGRRPATRPRTHIRLLLVDGCALFREAIRTCLDQAGDIKVVGEAGGAADMMQISTATRPDVVLTEFVLPDAPDGNALAKLHERFPAARIVVLTAMRAAQYLVDALANGAHGFVLKDAPCALVIKAIRAVRAGETWIQREMMGPLTARLQHPESAGPAMRRDPRLTQREREVLKLLADGNTTEEIAQQLYVSRSTVRVHLSRIIEKLALRNRIEAVRYAIKQGLAQL